MNRFLVKFLVVNFDANLLRFSKLCVDRQEDMVKLLAHFYIFSGYVLCTSVRGVVNKFPD